MWVGWTFGDKAKDHGVPMNCAFTVFPNKQTWRSSTAGMPCLITKYLAQVSWDRISFRNHRPISTHWEVNFLGPLW